MRRVALNATPKIAEAAGLKWDEDSGTLIGIDNVIAEAAVLLDTRTKAAFGYFRGGRGAHRPRQHAPWVELVGRGHDQDAKAV